jgi:hypothetical protein
MSFPGTIGIIGTPIQNGNSRGLELTLCKVGNGVIRLEVET